MRRADHEHRTLSDSVRGDCIGQPGNVAALVVVQVPLCRSMRRVVSDPVRRGSRPLQGTLRLTDVLRSDSDDRDVACGPWHRFTR
jgi:hypothetical protein